MLDMFMNNWEWVLLAMFVIEKIVKLSPSQKDDVIFDMVINPIFNAMKSKKK
tara:strand:- start:299 stop:454 length:156 start_codon:yes stop_codon:yes gene_type:complete